MKSDAEYITNGHVAADKARIPAHWAWRDSFIKTTVAIDKAFDRQADWRALHGADTWQPAFREAY